MIGMVVFRSSRLDPPVTDDERRWWRHRALREMAPVALKMTSAMLVMVAMVALGARLSGHRPSGGMLNALLFDGALAVGLGLLQTALAIPVKRLTAIQNRRFTIGLINWARTSASEDRAAPGPQQLPR